MKTLKKSMGIILALLMTVLFTTSAFAAEVKITERQYLAYQIFSGTQDDAVEGEDAPLCDIEWGAGIESTSFLPRIKAIETGEFADCESADDVAKVLTALSETINNNDVNDPAAVSAKKVVDEFARLADICKKPGEGLDLGIYANVVDGTAVDTTGATLESKLAPGYYLVVDNSNTSEQDTAKNLSLLQMTKNGKFVIGNKTDIPMVEKKVWENSYTAADLAPITNYQLEQGYNDIADHDIGENIPFILIGTMPSTLKDYDTYTYIFHDTMSKGLTYGNNAVVYVDNGNGLVVIPDSKYDIESKANAVTEGTDLTISFADVKLVEGINENSKIVVKYTAMLNSEAEIGLEGNTNEVYLEYSNNPNYDGSGVPGDGDDDSDSNDTGKSKVDRVIVFTYQLDVSKVDPDQKVLPGAMFKLKNNDTNMFYVFDEATKAISWTSVEADAYEFTSTDAEYFSAVGLDEGSYTLIETKAPQGYNKIAPITFEIEATTNNATTTEAQNWITYSDASTALTKLVIKLDNHTNASALNEGVGDTKSGSVKLKVVNNPGSLLPETGGMGTVVIYTIGAILAIGSVVLLVAKKRMNK